MAQDHELCRKKKQEKSKTGARAASAGPCCSCHKDSLAACKLLRRSWRTWTEQGAKQNEQNGGKQREGQWAWHGKGDTAGKQPAEQGHCRRTQPADNLPGTGLKKTTASRWPASQKNNSRRQSWLASRRAVQVDGGSAVVLALRRRAQTYLTVRLPPTYRLCLSLSLPTPLICTNPI